MAGRSVSRAKFEAEQLRIAEARALPSEPRSQPAEYSDALIPELIALADHGLTLTEVAAHWHVTDDELKEWSEGHPSFRRAIAQARTRSKAWWERSARLAMAERDTRYPAGLFSHVMRARYSEYDDKQGVVVNIDLGRLVMVDLRPELPSEQGADGPRPLIEGQTVGLGAGRTARRDPGAGLILTDQTTAGPTEDAPSSSEEGG